MNYDKIILELFNRVQTLEEQVKDLQCKIATSEEFLDEEYQEDDHGEYTRSQARQKAIEVIKSKYPEYVVEKALRKEGSGIKVFKPNTKRPLIIKFYHSKTFEHRTGNFEHGWHVVKIDDVIGTVVDLCIFSIVDSYGNWNFFIYDPDEIGIYNEENRSSERSVLHLYFTVKDGKAVEVREENVDVTNHLNNWHVLK